MSKLTKGEKIYYTDQMGAMRCLEFIDSGFIVGNFFRGLLSQEITSSRFKTETGQIIQVPDSAWKAIGIRYLKGGASNAKPNR